MATPGSVRHRGVRTSVKVSCHPALVSCQPFSILSREAVTIRQPPSSKEAMALTCSQMTLAGQAQS